MSVSFTTAAALVNELMEARDERRLLRAQKQMAAVKLLIIDELGFVPLSKTGAELLFEMISQRYERGATLITSNLPFVMSKTCILHDEWTETFGTERLTGALLDRLTHHVVRRAGRPLDAPLIRLTLRDERRKLSSGAKPRAKIRRNRLIQPSLAWP